MPWRRALLVLLLVAIRLVADEVHAHCFVDWERPKARAFYLHGGGDHDRCHHGQAPADPLTEWGCAASKDDQSVTLPEQPRLPVLVSAFSPLCLVSASIIERLPIAANGRSPPPFSLLSLSI